MPSKKKKYNARFPPARIKKIMQMDEDVGKVSAAVPVVISRALELFIEQLVKKTCQTTKERNAKTLSTAHIKHVVSADQRLGFLKTLMENVPDIHQDEDNGVASEDAVPSSSSATPSRQVKRKRDSSLTPTNVKVPKRRGRPPKVTAQSDSQDSDTEDDTDASISSASVSDVMARAVTSDRVLPAVPHPATQPTSPYKNYPVTMATQPVPYTTTYTAAPSVTQTQPLDLSMPSRGFVRHPGLPSPEREALEAKDRAAVLHASQHPPVTSHHPPVTSHHSPVTSHPPVSQELKARNRNSVDGTAHPPSESTMANII